MSELNPIRTYMRCCVLCKLAVIHVPLQGEDTLHCYKGSKPRQVVAYDSCIDFVPLFGVESGVACTCRQTKMPLEGQRRAVDARSAASTATPALACAALLAALDPEHDFLSACVVARQISLVCKTRVK